MFKKHERKDGTRMYIIQMEDSHIKNYLNMFLKAYEESKKANGEYTDMARTIVKNKSTYIYECFRRGGDMKIFACELLKSLGYDELSKEQLVKVVPRKTYSDEYSAYEQARENNIWK